MRCHEFEIQHRQSGDPTFRQLLQEVRVGLVSDSAMRQLRTAGVVLEPDGANPLHLPTATAAEARAGRVPLAVGETVNLLALPHRLY